MSFDSDGKAVVDGGSNGDQATGVAVQGDGRVVVSGATGATTDDFLAIRLTAGGAPDPTFSGDGKQTADLGASEVGEDLAVQSDGRLLPVPPAPPTGRTSRRWPG